MNDRTGGNRRVPVALMVIALSAVVTFAYVLYGDRVLTKEQADSDAYEDYYVEYVAWEGTSGEGETKWTLVRRKNSEEAAGPPEIRVPLLPVEFERYKERSYWHSQGGGGDMVIEQWYLTEPSD